MVEVAQWQAPVCPMQRPRTQYQQAARRQQHRRRQQQAHQRPHRQT